MQTRTAKLIGATTAMTAIAFSVPVAMTANAEPPPEPTPVAEIPDPKGPGCDAFKESVPNFKALAGEPVGDVLAAIPEISTFDTAISGGFNPAVDIVPVLNNGPYVVFAPTNEAFAKLPPEQLDALKADPAALTDLVYYHAFLGLLGPDDVKGQRPTQQGTEIEVTGEGDDIKVNESNTEDGVDPAKVVCGGIQASNARIYLIDTVLDMSTAPDPISATTTSTTETTEATETTEPTETPAEPTESSETPAETPEEPQAAEAPTEPSEQPA